MSETEDDLLSNNASSYQSGAMTIYVKGPNNSNINGYSFQNNFLSCPTQMEPYNFTQPKYVAMKWDQRSFYHRRELSPMSVSKIQGLGSHNFYNHPSGLNHRSYQQSVYNGRSGSPMSMRSIDSSASMSATEIALAFQNGKFNKYDLKLIKEAYNKHLKRRLRRSVEKRRKIKLYFKNRRQKSGEDSGDLGSDSSNCSDDCRSTRTATFKDNIPAYKGKKCNFTNHNKANESSSHDYTENVRQNYFTNILRRPIDPVHRTTVANSENISLMKNRLKSGLPLIAHRFNKFQESSSDVSKLRNLKDKKLFNENNKIINKLGEDSNSEQEGIFSEIKTVERNTEKNNYSHKRCYDIDEIYTNPVKKRKVSRTQLQNGLHSDTDCDNNENNNFVFAKPKLPVRKTTKVKEKTLNPEIIISSSHQSPSHAKQSDDSRLVTVKKNQLSHMSRKQTEFIKKPEKEIENIESFKEDHSIKELTIGPRFIKRKLFTQKLDIAENKNLCDNLQNNSPQVKNVDNNKNEKNKARKLASSQTCLNRDILAEDDNILDLIHKIVPADRLNVTTTNQSVTRNKYTQPDHDDKWDVFSVISTCNVNEGSDTYTDEEIFNSDKKVRNGTKCKPVKVQSNLNTNCYILLDKLPEQDTSTIKTTNVTTKLNVKDSTKNKLRTPQKSFWDTDYESDWEKERELLPHTLNFPRIHSITNKTPNNNTSCKKNEKVKINLITPNKAKRTVTAKNCATVDSMKYPENGRKCSQKSKKNAPDELKQFAANLTKRSLRSNSCAKDLGNENKLNEKIKTVTLISHRMLRSKRREKTKEACKAKQSPPKELNISVRSLRSSQKRNKT